MWKNFLEKIPIIFCAICISIIMCGTLSHAAYSGTKAAEYAKQYAESRNSAYPSFRRDCTNFASQCVRRGGVAVLRAPTKSIKYKHIGDIYKTKAHWNSGKYTRTTKIGPYKIYSKSGFVTTSTWSVVAKSGSWWGFYNHMKARGATTKEFSVSTEKKLNAFIKYCRVGDVVQIRKKYDKTKYHSAIVTRKTYNYKKKKYDMELCYHTFDRKSVSFRGFAWRGFGIENYWTCIKVSEARPYIF